MIFWCHSEIKLPAADKSVSDFYLRKKESWLYVSFNTGTSKNYGKDMSQVRRKKL